MDVSVLGVPPTSNLWTDATSIQTFDHVLGLNIGAYKDTNNYNFTVGASSNTFIEANNHIKSFVKDTGLVQLYSTTMQGSNRTDKEFINISQSNAYVSVRAFNSFDFKSTDAFKTLGISGMSLCNSGTHQIMTSSPGVNLLGKGIVLCNLVATNHVIGKDASMVYTDSSNEVGYVFRINASNDLEVVSYARSLQTNQVALKKAAIFKNSWVNWNSNMTSDASLSNYNPFSGLMSLYSGGMSTPTANTLGSVQLTNNTVSYTLSNYFTEPAGKTLTYSLTSNPYSSASIIGGTTLQVVGAYRASTYTVTVRATNTDGVYAESSLTVTETAQPRTMCGSYLNAGSSGFNKCTDIISDAVGNIYAIGNYLSSSAVNVVDLIASNTVRFQLPATGTGVHGFVIKYTANGIATAWTTMVCTNTSLSVNKGKFDANGNLYIVGRCTTTFSVYDFSTDATRTSRFNLSAGGFVVKFAPNGVASSWTSLSGTSHIVNDLVFDSNGNMYITGSFSTSAVARDFSTTNTSGTSRFTMTVTGNAGYLIKFNSSGTPLSWSVFQSLGVKAVNAMCIDSSNNIYITGSYSSTSSTCIVSDASTTSTTGQTRFNFPTTSVTNALVIKYDLTCMPQSWTIINSPTSSYGYDIAVDSYGNLYVVGAYSTSTSAAIYNMTSSAFIPGTVKFSIAGISGGYGIVIKYDSNGTAVSWAVTEASYGAYQAIQIDAQNNFIITGTYSKPGAAVVRNMSTTSNVGTSSFAMPSTLSSTSAMCTIRYNSNGIATSWTIIDGNGNENALAIFSDTTSNVYIGGNYNSTSNVAIVSFSTTNNLGTSTYSLPNTSNNLYPVVIYIPPI